MKNNGRKLLLITSAAFFALVISANVLSAETKQEELQIVPRLIVNIPTVQFTNLNVTVNGEVKTIDVPFLAQYISGVFTYAVGVASVIAAVMMMIGGLQWLTAGGSTDRVGLAKKRISNALVGLALSLGTYLILNTINPDLLKLKALQIQTVKAVPFDFVESGDSDEPCNPKPAKELPQGVYCPKSGGSKEIPKIIDSLLNKVVYRFGGKGGPPPYCETKPENRQYNDNCPEGKMCLDCSGFTSFVLKCAGMKLTGGGTGKIFTGAEEIKTLDLDKETVNGIKLQPGDLLGFLAGDTPPGRTVGHVYIYRGNGVVAESFGGARSGVKPNPKLTNLKLNDPKVRKKVEQHMKRIRRAQ